MIVWEVFADDFRQELLFNYFYYLHKKDALKKFEKLKGDADYIKLCRIVVGNMPKAELVINLLNQKNYAKHRKAITVWQR